MRARLLAACLVLAAATPSRALDLTGTWEEVKHSTCKGLDENGVKVALKNGDTGFSDLPISQSGNDLLMFIPGILYAFGGRIYAAPGSDSGQGIMQKCSNDPNVRITYRITKAETFEEKKGITGRMTTLYVFGGAASTYQCTIDWVRTSTADPGGTPCP